MCFPLAQAKLNFLKAFISKPEPSKAKNLTSVQAQAEQGLDFDFDSEPSQASHFKHNLDRYTLLHILKSDMARP